MMTVPQVHRTQSACASRDRYEPAATLRSRIRHRRGLRRSRPADARSLADWIADNATGCSTLYDGTGLPQPQPTPLKVKIPLPPLPGTIPPTACVGVNPNTPPNPTPAAPTGLVWNPTSTFVVPGQQTPDGKPIPAAFIWATEDGTISA